MKLYPLVFSFRDIIAGNGYVATVAMDGRVVLAEENDQDVWMFGVQPGGIAGGDRQKETAFVEFQNSYSSVLYDFAAEATSFDEFKEKVTAFFSEINGPNLVDWESSLAEVRARNVTLPNLAKVSSDSRVPSLRIEKVAESRVNSGENQFPEIAQAA